MTAVLLKCAAVVACAACVIATAVAAGRWRGVARHMLGDRRRRVIQAADAAGLALSSSASRVCVGIVPVSLWALRFLRRRRLARAGAQLPDALMFMGNALRAGLAFPQVLEMASIEVPPPLGEELSRAVAQLKLGCTVEGALALLAARVPTEDVQLAVQSIEVLRRSGGNVGETFRTLAQTVEARHGVEDRIRVLTAQGILQGVVLLALPWILGGALVLLSPEYMAPLFSTRAGWLCIGAGVVLECIGGLWLRRIVIVRV